MNQAHGRILVGAPNGTTDFGVIPPEAAIHMGHPAGPIRLHYGYPGDKGYGLLHVEGYETRTKQIRSAGFADFRYFCASICQHYSIIGKSKGRDDRFLLIEKKVGNDHYVVIQHDRDGYWSVTTGPIARVARYEKEIWTVTRTGGSEPTPSTTGTRPRFATLSLPGSKTPAGDKGP